MKKLTILWIVCFSLFIISCEKEEMEDEIQQEPIENEEETTEDSSTVHLDGKIYSDFKLWIGGEEIDTEGLDVYDYVLPDHQDGIPTEDNSVPYFSFQEDSVEYSNPDGTIVTTPGYFSNDTLYIEADLLGTPIDVPLGTGSEDELIVKVGFMSYVDYNFGTRIRGSYAMFGDFTFENREPQHNFENPAAMTEMDTVVIYNQTFLYE